MRLVFSKHKAVYASVLSIDGQSPFLEGECSETLGQYPGPFGNPRSFSSPEASSRRAPPRATYMNGIARHLSGPDAPARPVLAATSLREAGYGHGGILLTDGRVDSERTVAEPRCRPRLPGPASTRRALPHAPRPSASSLGPHLPEQRRP